MPSALCSSHLNTECVVCVSFLWRMFGTDQSPSHLIQDTSRAPREGQWKEQGVAGSAAQRRRLLGREAGRTPRLRFTLELWHLQQKMKKCGNTCKYKYTCRRALLCPVKWPPPPVLGAGLTSAPGLLTSDAHGRSAAPDRTPPRLSLRS